VRLAARAGGDVPEPAPLPAPSPPRAPAPPAPPAPPRRLLAVAALGVLLLVVVRALSGRRA
jgi:hypothetical protein